MEKKQGYSLFMAIAMIVGIVIGSGIFFKTDDMLMYTGGDVGKAVLIFCIAAFAIVFGGLCIAELAGLTDKPGGLITYFNEFMNNRWACMFGWFQTFIYYPTLTVILSWITGMYVNITFDLGLGFNGWMAIGIGWFIICYTVNILSAKFGAIIQEGALILKLIPIFGIGIASLLWGDPLKVLTDAPEIVAIGAATSWLAAVGPIAFSFDGWVVATSVAHEVRNSRKNMRLALIISPIFILLVYIMYFVGICGYVGPEQVMIWGDETSGQVASLLFGPMFGKLVFVFVVISIMGTTNGVILGFIRIPYSMALRNALPGSAWLRKIDPKTNMPVNSAIYAVGICAVWWAIHWIQNKYGLLVNGDVSEIAIVCSYALYVILYYQVFKLWRKGVIKSVFFGVISPLFATLGSVFIFVAGFSNPQIWLFFAICIGVVLIGYIYGKNSYKDAIEGDF